MSNETIENATSPPEAGQAKARSTKRTKPAKKAKATKATKAKVERANKKAEVIALMKRAKGLTLAEIMEETGGSRTRSVASSASWARRGVKRSNHPRA